MKKILFAIAHKATEDAIIKNLPEGEFQVAGIVTYKGGVLKNTEDRMPDILLLRDQITGNENILDLTYEIRTQFPSVRIIFLSDKDDTENNVIPTLVSYGIYDIIVEKKIKLVNILDIIENPRTLRDMSRYKLNHLPFNPPNDDRSSNSHNNEVVEEKQGLFGRIIGGKKKEVKDVVLQKKSQEELLVSRDKSLSQSQEELDQMLQEIENKERQILSLEENQSSLFEKSNLLEIRNKRLASDIERLNSELKIVEQTGLDAEVEIKVLVDRKGELETLLANRDGDSSLLQKEIEYLKEVWTSKDPAGKLLEQKVRLQAEIDATREGIRDIREIVEKKREQLQLLKEDVVRYGKEDVDLGKEIENEHKNLQQSLLKKTGLSEQVKREFDTLNDQSQALEKETASLKSEIESLQKQNGVLLDQKIELEQVRKTEMEKSAEPPICKDGDAPVPQNVSCDIVNIPNRKPIIIFQNEEKLAPVRPKRLFQEKVNVLKASGCSTVAFLGSKHGVGNSTLALNTAALLATKNRVLYIEINDRFPMSSYLLELLNISNGLEFAASYAGEGKTDLVFDEVLKPDNSLVPQTLHFLTFSNSYLIQEKADHIAEFSSENFGKLINVLKESKRYEFIILDMQPDENEVTGAILAGSIPVDQLFITMTQDVHSVGCVNFKIEQLKYGKGGLKDRTSYIVNHYCGECNLGIKEIANWVEVDREKIIPIALDYTILSNLGFEGKLFSLSPGGSSSFSSIIEKVLRNNK